LDLFDYLYSIILNVLRNIHLSDWNELRGFKGIFYGIFAMLKYEVYKFYLILIMKKITVFLITYFVSTALIYSQTAKKCIDFDGSNDHVDCDTSTSFHPAYLTIEAWINADTWRANNWQGTILSTDTWSGTGGQRGWVLRTGDNGRLTLLIANGSTAQWMECMSAQIMSTSKWYHVAGTYDGSVQKVYINGVLVQTLSNTGGIRYNGMDKMIIGDCVGQLANRVFDGKIDEVRLWKVALDTNTLRQWMHKPISSAHPQSANLIAYYKMNEGSGTKTYDSSGHGFNGNLNNFGTTPWLASYLPIASAPSSFLNDVASVWSAKANASSSVVNISGTYSGNNYVVFGHNAKNLSYYNGNKPSYILKRVARLWRIETEGSLSGTLTFDYSAFDTTNFNTYKLLVSSDTNFSNASVISGTKKGNKKIAFNITFQDSFYYTIGAYDFQAPTVQTSSIDEVKAFSAKVTGKVLDDGGLTTTRGLCWSTSSNPTIFSATKAFSGTGVGSYQVNLTNLSQNTTYHVRAFAFNSKDTVYGADSTFKTPVASPPIVTTDGRLNIYADSVKYKGTVVSDGNVSLTEKGFCWSTSVNPKANLSSKMAFGTGIGAYTGTLKILNPSTTYHIRAYAINAVDTAYGADSTITTLPISVPTVFNLSISNIEGYSAKMDGIVTFNGNRNVSAKGVVWSTSANPTVSLSTKTDEGAGNGSFTSSISGLQPNTTYHVRSYATNAVGSGYASDTTFITAAPPEVVIHKINAIGYYNADIYAEVLNDGRMPVKERGVCWSVSPNPKISTSSKITLGTGVGAFTAGLTGLNPNTIYYVRSYAINAVDTAYSADSSFKTVKTNPPTITTSTLSNITSKSAICGGNVLKDGGTSVTSRGVCWSTIANPKASLTTKTVDGYGLGVFSSNLTGLNPGTVYHVRAYAINNVDTSYGGDSVFKTLGPPTVTTDNVTMIDNSTAAGGGTVTNDGGSIVIKRGVCWATSQNPNIKDNDASTDGFGLGHFNSTLYFLSPGTKYYVRAYAINSIDTGYGNEVSFITPSLPVVSTTNVTAITGKTATSGGVVVSGDGVTERGVVWSLYANPTIALTTKTKDGSGLGVFTSNISGLTPNTDYHVRAYATNNMGTAYGSDIIFKTANKPVVTTAAVNVTAPGQMSCGGNVTSDGGMSLTMKGVCWSTSSNPVASGNKTNDGTGTGTFVSTITGLNPNITYYFRAYAINGVDTSYGQERTGIITPPVVVTGNWSDVQTNSATISGSVNANGQLTNVTFEYGKTTTYGNTIQGNPSSTSANIDENVTAILTGLTHNTTYHYRIKAESTHGLVYGQDSSFTTQFDISIDEKDIFNIVIKANQHQIILQFGNNEFVNGTVNIIDAIGQIVVSEQLNDGIIQVEKPIVPGIYLFRLQSNGQQFCRKIFIN